MTEPVFDRLWHDITSRLHHPGQPATYDHNHNQGGTMDLSAIAADIKDHVEQGTDWFKQVIEQHVPAILAAAEKYQASPIIQALEGVVLPPAVEQEVAAIIKRFAELVPQQTPADTHPDASAPAEGDPAQPADAALAAS